MIGLIHRRDGWWVTASDGIDDHLYAGPFPVQEDAEAAAHRAAALLDDEVVLAERGVISGLAALQWEEPVPSPPEQPVRAPRTVDALMVEISNRSVQIRYYLGTGRIQVREGLTLRHECDSPDEVEDRLCELLFVTEEERGALRAHLDSLLIRWARPAPGLRFGAGVGTWGARPDIRDLGARMADEIRNRQDLMATPRIFVDPPIGPRTDWAALVRRVEYNHPGNCRRNADDEIELWIPRLNCRCSQCDDAREDGLTYAADGGWLTEAGYAARAGVP